MRIKMRATVIVSFISFCFSFILGFPQVEARSFNFGKPRHSKHAEELRVRAIRAAQRNAFKSSGTQPSTVSLSVKAMSLSVTGNTGSISGYVRDMGGTPLANADITLYQGVDPNWADDDSWDHVAWTETDASGFYRFSGLADRRYHLHYWQEQEIGGKHYIRADQYQVQVLGGANTPNIDFALRQAGLIWGYVKKADGSPLQGWARVVSRAAYTENGSSWHEGRLDENGMYKLWVLSSPGKFYPIFVEEAMETGTTYKVYGGYNYICDEDVLHPENHGYTLLGSATSTQTFSGAYSYYIILAEDGNQAKVDAIQASNGNFLRSDCGWGVGDWSGIDSNPPDGNYVTVNDWIDSEGDDPGSITVNPGFGNTGITVHITNDSRTANPVYYETQIASGLYQATLGGVHGPDFTLNIGGKIHGRIVNEAGNPVERVEMEPSLWINGDIDEPDTYTDANGYYTLTSVPVSNQAYAYIGEDPVMQDGVKYASGQAFVGPLTITAGGTTEVPDMTIMVAGMITGRITDENGFPIVGAEVEAGGHDKNGNEFWSDNEAYTDAFGQYTVDYMAPGTYTVDAEKDGFTVGFKTNVVVTSEGQTDCDLVMTSSSQAPTVSGVLTNYAAIAPKDGNGVLLPYPDGSDYDDFGYHWVELVAFPGNVNYTDEYYLNISPTGHSYFDDGYGDYFAINPSETVGSYDLVLSAGAQNICVVVGGEHEYGWSAVLYDWHSLVLTEGTNITGENFTVPTNYGNLQGSISVPSGTLKPQRTMIVAFNENDNSPGLFDALGGPEFGTTYRFSQMPAGTYTIRAISDGFETKVHENVVVTQGATTTLDINFAGGGTLSGTVTDAGAAVESAMVKVIETGTVTHTDSNGNYTINGLSAGSYTVEISASRYATDTQTVTITDGATTTHDVALNAQVGSISGSVTDSAGGNINNATVVAYNTATHLHKTVTTVGGAYSIADLIYGNYVVAVNADGYAVKTYPNEVTISGADPNPPDIDFSLTGIAPEFSVSSSISGNTLSLTFYSDIPLDGAPTISVVSGSGSGTLGTVTTVSNTQWQVDYTTDPGDTIVRIKIEGISSGMTGSETTGFEVTSNLQETASTNVTNAAGGKTTMMGTQDNTAVYVPPFALAGTGDDTTALALSIERYGDPGDSIEGTDDKAATAVYDFSFEDDNVEVAENHTLTVTMSFELPAGMTQEEFENTFEVRYFNVNAQQWVTDGISNVRINWNSYTIMFEVSHLSKFAAFITEGCSSDGDVNDDNNITPQDALMTFQHYLGIITLDQCRQSHANVNNDGSITPADALCIFQKYLGLSSCLD